MLDIKSIELVMAKSNKIGDVYANLQDASKLQQVTPS
jgi:hypothetical protein